MNVSSQFHIQTRPLQVPLELLALGVETPVIGIEPTGTHYTTAGKLAGYIRETIERQAAGRFYLWEAAQILAETHEKSLQAIKNAMRKAFSLGVLRVRMTDSDAPMGSDSRLRVEGMDSYATPGDLNKWLEADGYPYRFPIAPEPASAPAVAVAAPTPAPSASAPPTADTPAPAPSASAPTVAPPEPAATATQAETVPGAGIVRHALKSRRNPLDAVYARAKQEATDQTCPHSVWAALVAMATGSNPPRELGEYRRTTEMIKATGARGGWLKKRAFMDKWRNDAKRVKPS
jgi:hypothetical protein